MTGPGEKTKIKNLISTAKKTIVFLGRITEEGEAEPYATGFLVRVKNIYHLITAKHVVIDKKTKQLRDDRMYAFFNKKDGKVTALSIKELKDKDRINWIFHANDAVDIAIIPFPLNETTDDVVVIAEDMFLTIENLFELYDVFFLSFQPGTKYESRTGPVIRSGVISRINEDETFYIDAAAFPGNSGSPVFLRPHPISFTEAGISFRDPLGGKFIGVIGEYIPYEEVAISIQTGLPRIVFQENTGISVVWSITYIKQVIASTQFSEQLNNLKSQQRIMKEKQP